MITGIFARFFRHLHRVTHRTGVSRADQQNLVPRTVKLCTFASLLAGSWQSPAITVCYATQFIRSRSRSNDTKKGLLRAEITSACSFATVSRHGGAQRNSRYRGTVFHVHISDVPGRCYCFAVYQYRQQNHHRFDDHLVIGGNT
ncbi:hypothetical protein KCP71_06020 [Salmonella enterica subsp. enterica]|nr:hypothetical protein KCP71_06020 [Salmonella enterica subsp. enterica]